MAGLIPDRGGFSQVYGNKAACALLRLLRVAEDLDKAEPARRAMRATSSGANDGRGELNLNVLEVFLRLIVVLRHLHSQMNSAG